MSIHRSLKAANALERHRNVLSRAERIKTMKDQEKWEDGRSVFGLPKIAHRKVAIAKTKKAAAAVEGAEGAAAAPGAAPAAGVEAAKEGKPAGKPAAKAAGKEAKPAGKEKK